MDKVDYKIFVPTGDVSFLRVKDKDFQISEMQKINIFFFDNRVSYWFWVKIDEDDCSVDSGEYKYTHLFLKKEKVFDACLRLDGSYYQIKGKAQTEAIDYRKYERKYSFMIYFHFDDLHDQMEEWVSEKQAAEVNKGELLDI